MSGFIHNSLWLLGLLTIPILIAATALLYASPDLVSRLQRVFLLTAASAMAPQDLAEAFPAFADLAKRAADADDTIKRLTKRVETERQQDSQRHEARDADIVRILGVLAKVQERKVEPITTNNVHHHYHSNDEQQLSQNADREDLGEHVSEALKTAPEVLEMRSSYNQAIARIEALEKVRSLKDGEDAQVTAQLHVESTKRQQAESALARAAEKEVKLQEEHSRTLQELEQTRQAFEAAQTAQVELQEWKSGATREYHQLRHDTDIVTQQAQRAVQTLEQERGEAEATMQALRQEYDDLKVADREVRRQNRDHREAIKSLNRKLNREKSAVRQLESQLYDSRRRYKSLVSDVKTSALDTERTATDALKSAGEDEMDYQATTTVSAPGEAAPEFEQEEERREVGKPETKADTTMEYATQSSPSKPPSSELEPVETVMSVDVHDTTQPSTVHTTEPTAHISPPMPSIIQTGPFQPLKSELGTVPFASGHVTSDEPMPGQVKTADPPQLGVDPSARPGEDIDMGEGVSVLTEGRTSVSGPEPIFGTVSTPDPTSRGTNVPTATFGPEPSTSPRLTGNAAGTDEEGAGAVAGVTEAGATEDLDPSMLGGDTGSGEWNDLTEDEWWAELSADLEELEGMPLHKATGIIAKSTGAEATNGELEVDPAQLSPEAVDQLVEIVNSAKKQAVADAGERTPTRPAIPAAGGATGGAPASTPTAEPTQPAPPDDVPTPAPRTLARPRGRLARFSKQRLDEMRKVDETPMPKTHHSAGAFARLRAHMVSAGTLAGLWPNLCRVDDEWVERVAAREEALGEAGFRRWLPEGDDDAGAAVFSRPELLRMMEMFFAEVVWGVICDEFSASGTVAENELEEYRGEYMGESEKFVGDTGADEVDPARMKSLV